MNSDSDNEEEYAVEPTQVQSNLLRSSNFHVSGDTEETQKADSFIILYEEELQNQQKARENALLEEIEDYTAGKRLDLNYIVLLHFGAHFFFHTLHYFLPSIEQFAAALDTEEEESEEVPSMSENEFENALNSENELEALYHNAAKEGIKIKSNEE